MSNMSDAATSGANAGARGNTQNMQNAQGTTGDQNDTRQPEWSIDLAPNDPLAGVQGERDAGTQPNVAGADQPTAIFPRTNPQPSEADDPEGTNLVPPMSTGEQHWVDEQIDRVTGSGALTAQDEDQYTNPEYAGIQGNMMGSTSTIQGESFEQGLPPGEEDLPPGNEGFVESKNDQSPTEEYGQGETRQFSPAGMEPGIEQQDQLQSQQYEREEQRSRQGILGVAGDMLGALFGNPKRTPVPPPADEEEVDADEGEAAGEAHP